MPSSKRQTSTGDRCPATKVDEKKADHAYVRTREVRRAEFGNNEYSGNNAKRKGKQIRFAFPLEQPAVEKRKGLKVSGFTMSIRQISSILMLSRRKARGQHSNLIIGRNFGQSSSPKSKGSRSTLSNIQQTPTRVELIRSRRNSNDLNGNNISKIPSDHDHGCRKQTSPIVPPRTSLHRRSWSNKAVVDGD